MSKLSEKVKSLVRYRQQRGGDQTLAKNEPLAVGMYGEDLTNELNWLLRSVQAGHYKAQDAWDTYKRIVNKTRGHQPYDNRIGAERPPRVSIPRGAFLSRDESTVANRERQLQELVPRRPVSLEEEYARRVAQHSAVEQAARNQA